MKILVLSGSQEAMSRAAVRLEHDEPAWQVLVRSGAFDGIGPLVDQESPDVLVLEDAGDTSPALGAVDAIVSRHPGLFVMMASSRQDTERLVEVMRAGVREVLPSPLALETLEPALRRAAAWVERRPGVQRGDLIGFMSAKGGSGATFIATNVGYQLAATGSKVLLIDLNLQFGEALLNLHDRKAHSDVVQLARDLPRLDAALLAASVVAITPNFGILAAPDDPGQSLDVRPEQLGAILDLAARHHDYVLLDLNCSLDELTVHALDRVHRLMVVVQARLPYLRNAIRLLDVFRSLGYSSDKVSCVVNRFERSSEIGLAQVQAALAVARIHTLPNAYQDVARSIDLGVPFKSIADPHPVQAAICRLADALRPAGAVLPPKPAAGLFARLRGSDRQDVLGAVAS